MITSPNGLTTQLLWIALHQAFEVNRLTDSGSTYPNVFG
jgi:hypothetical protein